MNETSHRVNQSASDRQVLFLDYDGVVHRFGAIRTRRGIISVSPSIKLFEFAPVLAEWLEPYKRLEIVLSTSWVRILGYQRAKAALPATLRERVIGATYHSRYYDASTWPSMERGIQVLRYVRTHRLTRWLAIDDEIAGFEDCLSHVVRCDEQLGLGDAETQKLVRNRLAEQFK